MCAFVKGEDYANPFVWTTIILGIWGALGPPARRTSAPPLGRLCVRRSPHIRAPNVVLRVLISYGY